MKPAHQLGGLYKLLLILLNMLSSSHCLKLKSELQVNQKLFWTFPKTSWEVSMRRIRASPSGGCSSLWAPCASVCLITADPFLTEVLKAIRVLTCLSFDPCLRVLKGRQTRRPGIPTWPWQNAGTPQRLGAGQGLHKQTQPCSWHSTHLANFPLSSSPLTLSLGSFSSTDISWDDYEIVLQIYKIISLFCPHWCCDLWKCFMLLNRTE